MNNNKIFFCVEYDKWTNFCYENIVNEVCEALSLSNKEISFLLTDDNKIQQLNKQYRNKDYPTNVLSFESGDDVVLGDIVISFDTLLRESIENNKSFDDHFTHLVIHGILHLLGYDHIIDSDAQIMEQIEIDTLKKLNIGNPYE